VDERELVSEIHQRSALTETGAETVFRSILTEIIIGAEGATVSVVRFADAWTFAPVEPEASFPGHEESTAEGPTEVRQWTYPIPPIQSDELLRTTSESSRLGPTEVERALNIVLRGITAAIDRGDEVEIGELGTVLPLPHEPMGAPSDTRTVLVRMALPPTPRPCPGPCKRDLSRRGGYCNICPFRQLG
jgi:nucleoid DNA-binding protein